MAEKMAKPLHCSIAMKKHDKNRRQHRRYTTKTVWANEYSGDYQYRLVAENISAGGIFLKGHTKITNIPSRMVIRLGRKSLEVMAEPVHDHVIKCAHKNSVGVGYRFLKLSPQQNKILTSYLGNLN
jgi:hypothetical protein